MGKNEVNGMTLFDCILFYLSGTFWALARANFIKYKIIKSLIGSKWWLTFIDWIFLSLPMTVFQLVPDQLTSLVVILASVSLIHLCFQQKGHEQEQSDISEVPFDQIFYGPCKIFRMAVLTTCATAILAVDFSIFPRQFAKTEKYGFSLMDTGTAAFIFVNAISDHILSVKNRLNQRLFSKMNVFCFKIPILPLIALLAFARSIFIHISGYGQNVTEYGVHWNFFATLFFLRLSVALIPFKHIITIGVIIGVLYQMSLSLLGLEEWILRDSTIRVGFIDQNREGIFSTFGYFSVYALSLAYVRVINREPKKYSMLVGFALTALCLGLQIVAETVLQTQASRRLANLPYAFSMVALFSLTVNAARMMSLYTDISAHSGGMIDSVGRNALLYFLISNLLTGLTNMFLRDLIYSIKVLEIIVLLAYSIILTVLTGFIDAYR